MSDFKHSDICWKDNTLEHKQSMRFGVGNNFLLYVIAEPKRRGAASLDHILTSNNKLTGDVKVKGNLVCSDHEMMKFRIPRAGRRVISKLTIPDFREADWPLQRSFWKNPWREGRPRKAG